MKKFEFLEHTADLRIRVYGQDLTQVFLNSLLALKSYFKPKLTSRTKLLSLNLENKSTLNLLIDGLTEVLSQTYINKTIFDEIKKGKVEEEKIEVILRGKKFTSLQRDIKAITYHQARLIKQDSLFLFEFIIDI